jgi:PDZ domain-containing protein
VAALAAPLLVVAVVGMLVELPYYTIAPGDALEIGGRVTISEAPSDQPEGEILLLFVRQNARVNAWQWLQASLDGDIDLFEEREFTGGQSPDELRARSEAEMARSQLAAKKLALEAAGYEVPEAEGLYVAATLPESPASDVLEVGDVVLAADGARVVEVDDLGKLVRARRPGETIGLRVRRDDAERTIRVDTFRSDEGTTAIGVLGSPSYDLPVDVDIDTSDIGGPSAGLAMTLSVLDRLTAGELTGGARVAVTGSIGGDGEVMPVGGIGQKAVAARAAGATLFLVPATEVREARERAGDVRVVGVDDLDDALVALRRAGGDAPKSLAPTTTVDGPKS